MMLKYITIECDGIDNCGNELDEYNCGNVFCVEMCDSIVINVYNRRHFRVHNRSICVCGHFGRDDTVSNSVHLSFKN